MNTKTITSPTLPRLRDIEDAKANLHGCTKAICGAASAFAAALNISTPTIDGDDAYEILISIYERQSRALAKLDALVAAGMREAHAETPNPKKHPSPR